MSELPSGTVTFLFTDIEGSTRLLRELGERYAEVLGRHDRLVRDACAGHGGREIRTQGDGFFVAFTRATDAVAAAVQVQRALMAERWPDATGVRVRMGLHTGEPMVTASDYVGLAVHRAARICAVGHGGQILLSSATRELLEDDLPREISFRDLGKRRLKDFDRPEHLFELLVALDGPAAGVDRASTALPGASAGASTDVRYAQSADVSIAYQVVGDGPLDLVLVHGWVCSFYPGWERPQIARFYGRLAGMGRLILFDKRGTGLSDRVKGIAPLEERMDDLRAVLDAVGSERTAILGVSEGGTMAALFAATYPDRTAALIAMGTFARRLKGPDYPIDVPQQWFAVEEWGLTAARRFVEERAPSLAGDEEAIHWYASYLVRGGTAGASVQLSQMNLEIDVRHVLPSIHVPSLVLYRSREYLREASRYVGEHIPDARVAELPGADHLPWEGDADGVLDEIEAFLADIEAHAEVDRVLTTVLHIRVDESHRELLRGHHARFRGTEIRGGGGLRASFDGPARAIRCALAIVDHAAALGVDAAAGLHTGECEVAGRSLRGEPLEIAASIAAVAATGEVLVSSTVRDLVAGSGAHFREHRAAAPPGIVHEIGGRLFAIDDTARAGLAPPS
jgi:class 3 adenylate cyclase